LPQAGDDGPAQAHAPLSHTDPSSPPQEHPASASLSQEHPASASLSQEHPASASLSQEHPASAPPQAASPAGTHVPAQAICPSGQPHDVHWQSAPHVRSPLTPHGSVAAGWQAPSPVHDDQGPHWPSAHARVCVPHDPQGWLEGPVQD
jgi:hypothetical protein